jgi:pimeloyl-ACP methyl ester carboxylesterase
LKSILRFLNSFVSLFAQNDAAPSRVDFRSEGQAAALILLHGFSGDTRATWAGFPDLLLSETSISTWDVYGLGFPSSLRIDIPKVWAADPEIEILAQGLSTTLKLAPFHKYKVLALAAHSMGGLVAQRAILNDGELSGRISKLFLFGTPTGGLPKSRLVSKLKRQFQDMSPASDFIRDLKRDWKDQFGEHPPFDLRVVAGDRDDFVPPSSSLVPFPKRVQAVVPGNHLEIVKPSLATHQSVRIVVDSLSGTQRKLPAVDGARLAIELGQFRSAVDTLLPMKADLDSNALVSLALALEGVDRAPEALNILETYGHKKSTDAIGTLAGRLKRRWLATRDAKDFARAKALYQEGVRQSEENGDHDQSFYHLINVAFLELMDLPPASAISEPCKQLARRVLAHCKECAPSHWRSATEGEAHLILGEIDTAFSEYAAAIGKTSSQREIDSMYAQAFRVAERVFGEQGLLRLEEVFGYGQGT